MLYRTLLMSTALALLSATTLTAPAARAQERPQTPPAQPPAQPQTDEADDQDNTEVEQVVVTAARSDIISRADRMSYDVTNDLQAQTGTVADVLRNVPGVEVDLQGNVSLRGDGNVTILIDGRPSGMLRGGGRADALQSMSAGQIARVEVITNPSAAFSPEGSGGIINLVTKPSRPSVTTGTIRAGWDGGERGNVSLSGSRSAEGLTLAGDLGYRRDHRDIETEQLRTRTGATPATTITESGQNTGANRMEMANARASVDYDLNARDRLSGEFNIRDINGESENTEVFERANGLGVVSDRYARTSDQAFGNTGTSARASWRRKFSGDLHELVTDFEFDRNESDRTLDAFSDTTVGGGADYAEHIESSTQRDAWGLKVDYTRPMSDGRQLKLGYEGDLSLDDFDSYGARGLNAASLTPVAALTNRFAYDQWIHAGYATYDFPIGELDIQAGLRVEQVEFKLEQITDGITVERDYLRAYPTLHLGYQLTDSQRLRGSYSRRIQRPSPQDLNPYTIYIDPQNLRRGNPDLEPEITDSFEMSWQLRSGRTFYSVTAFYRDSSGGVTDVAQDLGGGVVLTTRENLGESQRTGAEFLANGRFGDKVTYNISGSVYRNEIYTPGLSGTGRQSGTTGTARASLNWQPTADDFFQLNGFYVGEQVQAQGAREPFGVLNLGYRHKVSDAFSVVVTGSNILDTAEQRVAIDTPDFSDRTRVRFGKPTWFIGFTYTLGNGQPRRQEPQFDFGSPTGPG